MTHFNILKQAAGKPENFCSCLLLPLCHGAATKDRVMHYPSGFPAFVEALGGEGQDSQALVARREGCAAGGGDKRSPQVPERAMIKLAF